MKKLGKMTRYLLLFLFSCSFIFLLVTFLVRESSKVFLEEKTIDAIVKKINLMELLMNQAGEYTVKGKDIHDLIAKTGIPEEAMEDFLESEATKELMISYTKTSLDYLVKGKELPELNSEELLDTFDEAMKELVTLAQKENLPYAEKLTEHRQAEIRKEAEVYIPKMVEKIPSAEAWLTDELQKHGSDSLESLKKAEANVQTIRDQLQFFFGPSVTYLWLGILFVLAILIALVRFSKTLWLIWLGFGMSVAGAISFLIGTFFSQLVSFFLPIPASFERVVQEVFQIFSGQMIPLSYALFIPGLLFLFLFAIFRFLEAKKENKAYETM